MLIFIWNKFVFIHFTYTMVYTEKYSWLATFFPYKLQIKSQWLAIIWFEVFYKQKLTAELASNVLWFLLTTSRWRKVNSINDSLFLPHILIYPIYSWVLWIASSSKCHIILSSINIWWINISLNSNNVNCNDSLYILCRHKNLQTN